VNSIIVLLSARENKAADDPQHLPERDCQYQIDGCRDDVGLEGAEGSRLYEVRGKGQILGSDLRHDR
jgi:hypothetical protein